MINQWQSYIYLSALVLMIYDYCLRLDDEIKYIWRMSWSLGKSLYLWNQYASVAIFITGNFWTLPMPQDLAPTSDLGYYHWVGIARVLLIVCPQIIMSLRVYAVYRHHKFILALLILLMLGQIAFLLGFTRAKRSGSRNLCMIFNPNIVRYSHIVYIPALILDGTLVLLVIYKAWPSYSGGFIQPLMRMIVRQYVSYFAVVFFLYLVVVITAKVDVDANFSVPHLLILNDICAAYALAVPSIMANRLLISLRTDYYRHEEAPSVSRPIQFKRMPQRIPATRDSVEFSSYETTYDERLGV